MNPEEKDILQYLDKSSWTFLDQIVYKFSHLGMDGIKKTLDKLEKKSLVKFSERTSTIDITAKGASVIRKNEKVRERIVELLSNRWPPAMTVEDLTQELDLDANNVHREAQILDMERRVIYQQSTTKRENNLLHLGPVSEKPQKVKTSVKDLFHLTSHIRV